MSEKAILICSCSGACPSMEDIDFWELSERIRLELPNKYTVLHPRLCEENGERFLEATLDNDTQYITVACKPEKQEKLLRDGFERAGVEMGKENFRPVALNFKDTETVFEEIKEQISD